MKRIAVTLFAIVAVLFATLGVADASITWSNAQTIPGFSAIGATGSTDASLILCPSFGYCAALGNFIASPGISQGFRTGNPLGPWVNAEEIPDLATLNAGGIIDIRDGACVADDYCIAAGTYSSGLFEQEGFIVAADGTVAPIPGLIALNTGNSAVINDVACSSPGNCTIVGAYSDGVSTIPFIADQVGGSWRNAMSLGSPGQLYSVSCPADGECVAAGTLVVGPQIVPAAIVRASGTWDLYTSIPGVASIGTGEGSVTDVACPAADTCYMIGTYVTGAISSVFTSTLSSGTWSNATQLPGIASLDTQGLPGVIGLSCWSATNCLGVGDFSDVIGGHTWTAEVVDGAWAGATDLPGFSALSSDGTSNAMAMSCASDGMCAIVGNYILGQTYQGFIAVRHPNGTIDAAIDIPGLRALNVDGYGDPKSVSCTVGGCGISGFFDAGPDYQAFVATMAFTPDPEPTTTTTTAADQPVAPAFTG